MVFDFDPETWHPMDSSSTKRHYEFLTQNFRPVMFSLYREAAEASVDLFSVSNRDEISGNRFALTRPT